MDDDGAGDASVPVESVEQDADVEAEADTEAVAAVAQDVLPSADLGRDALPTELELPLSNIVRVVKEHLPAGCSITKDAKMAFSKATSLFILYLTAT
jgi:hypothetical protein